MASNGNFCTLNPLAQLGGSTDASTRAGSMSGGNLKYVNLTGNTAVGNFGVTSGKWYFEVYVSSFNADNGMIIGWANDMFNIDTELGYNNVTQPSGAQAFGLYSQNQTLLYGPGNGSSTYNKSYGSGTPTDGDIIRIWLDADNGRFWGGLNGTIHNSGDPSAGTNWGFGTGGSPHNIAMTTRTLFPAIGNWSSADATVIFNFGQDSTFQGAITAGTETDGNGFGNFKYSTEGFLALCSANLPISDDIDPAQTDDNYPSKNFNVVTYTGNGNSAARTINGFNFSPDLIWVKSRSGAYNNMLVDSTRGGDKYFYSNATNAQLTASNMITFGDSDGYVMRDDGTYLNQNSGSYVAWGWKAGGSASSDASGDITVSRSTNSASKFTIATWTGNGVSGSTIPHGLGVAPAMTFIKKLDATSATNVWHQGNNDGDPDSFGELSSNAAWYQNQGVNGPYTVKPDATNLTLTAYGQVNGSSNTYVGYFWADVEGMQKFGTYEGNANNDGTFVYTGFRPRMLFIKNTEAQSPWCVYDGARPGFNQSYLLSWDEVTSENTSSYPIDILSNGFKFRTSNATINSSHTWVYGAWSDVPFKYNNTF